MTIDEQIEFIKEQQFKVDLNSKEDLIYNAVIKSLEKLKPKLDDRDYTPPAWRNKKDDEHPNPDAYTRQ